MEDLKNDKRRKATYINGNFQLLKPAVIDARGEVTEWYSYGGQRSIKAIYDIINRQGPYQIVVMDTKTQNELERYVRAKEGQLAKKL